MHLLLIRSAASSQSVTLPPNSIYVDRHRIRSVALISAIIDTRLLLLYPLISPEARVRLNSKYISDSRAVTPVSRRAVTQSPPYIIFERFCVSRSVWRGAASQPCLRHRHRPQYTTNYHYYVL